MVAECSFYPEVPKELKKNLWYRDKMWRWGCESEQNAQTLMEACSRDLLYWINTFVWTYDPRLPDYNEQPFISYPFQDEAFHDINAAIGRRDLAVEKSRDQGASWMFLIAYYWRFRFRRRQTFLIVSRNEKLVDKAHDPDCLFWKLDYIHEHLPPWMMPTITRNMLIMVNHENNSTITGVSTTGDIGRGGRRTSILMDEFASFDVADAERAYGATQHSTHSRMFNSTPKGVGNAFYKVTHPPMRIKKLRFHWSQHPVQAKGLYTSTDGELRLLDRGYWKTLTVADVADQYDLIDFGDAPGDAQAVDYYPFIYDGKLRSPYYDHECERTPVKSLIAQELDIDYLGSGSQFFDQMEIDRCVTEFSREPFAVGELHYDHDTHKPEEFKKVRNGRLSLWTELTSKGEPRRDRNYFIGVDVSAGTGASNSCMAVGDDRECETVAMFVTPHLRPEKLADYAYALGTWFTGADGEPAYMIWEGQGSGSDFGGRLRDLGYSRLHYHVNESTADRRISKKPGWFATGEGKLNILTEFGRALAAGDIVVRSRDMLEEMGQYVWAPGGKVEHQAVLAATDPSGASKAHGDRVASGALMWYAMRKQPRSARKQRVIPPNCLAARNRMHKERELAGSLW